MMLGFVILPMQVGQLVLGFLERMGDVALRDPESMRQDAGDEIAIRVIPDDEIGTLRRDEGGSSVRSLSPRNRTAKKTPTQAASMPSRIQTTG